MADLSTLRSYSTPEGVVTCDQIMLTNVGRIVSYSTPEGVVTCDLPLVLRNLNRQESYSTPEGVVTCDATLVDCLPTRSSALNSRGSG